MASWLGGPISLEAASIAATMGFCCLRAASALEAPGNWRRQCRSRSSASSFRHVMSRRLSRAVKDVELVERLAGWFSGKFELFHRIVIGSIGQVSPAIGGADKLKSAVVRVFHENILARLEPRFVRRAHNACRRVSQKAGAVPASAMTASAICIGSIRAAAAACAACWATCASCVILQVFRYFGRQRRDRLPLRSIALLFLRFQLRDLALHLAAEPAVAGHLVRGVQFEGAAGLIVGLFGLGLAGHNERPQVDRVMIFDALDRQTDRRRCKICRRGWCCSEIESEPGVQFAE